MVAKMKTNIFVIVSFLISFMFTSCEKEWDDERVKEPVDNEKPGNASDIPEGYFEAVFSTGAPETRVAVTGQDARVRHLRYLIYKSTGEFVKEKIVLAVTNTPQQWPMAAVKDTLPKGNYVAIFLANVEKTLFPFQIAGGGQGTAEVLANYQGQMSDARILLPSGQFSDTSEYYWANVSFSDQSPHPYILLQRIISLFNVHRNFVDAQTALNQLVNNIVTQLQYKNYIQTTVQGLLPGLIKAVIDRGNPIGNLVFDVVGGLDAAANTLAGALVVPVTNALYDLLLQNLVNQIGSALGGNADQAGAIARLGALLNPWQPATAHTAVVTLRNFPKTMDFGLNVKSYYDGDHNFQFDFPQTSIYNEKDVLIKGFHGLYDVRKIRITSGTLIGGLLVDDVVDGPLLLNGTFVNITDSVQANIPTNRRYKSNYSFLDLGLKSYTQQTDGPHTLSLSVKIGNIANIDNLLFGIPILGPLLNTTLNFVLSPVKNLTVTVPVNLPLLGVENLSLSGGWSTPTAY